nr:ABC transporter substrate-binding protein [uncultured Deefgea sp.]
MKKCVALMFFLLASQLAHVAPLRVGIEANSPPKWIGSSQHKMKGFCPDLFKLLSSKDASLAFIYPLGFQPQKRIEHEVENATLDLLCALTRNTEREARFQYINHVLYNMDFVLVVRAQDSISPQSWDEIRLLGNQGTILLNYDSSAIGRLSNLGGLSLDSTGQTIEINLKKLQHGRGRFFYYPRYGVMAEMRRLGNSQQFRLTSPALETVPFYLIAGKHLSNKVLLSLQGALQAAEKSGELQQLRNKWFN